MTISKTHEIAPAPDQTILSPSRALDGVSENAASIPAVAPHDDRRIDGIHDLAKPTGASLAGGAVLSRRNIMNVLVSTAAVAAAVPTAAFPIAAKPDQSDARLIELEQVIMTEYAKATEHDDEIDRLSAISAEEYCRLAKALYVVAASEIRCPTKEEKDAIWDKVYGISEFDDESRLKKLCEPH